MATNTQRTKLVRRLSSGKNLTVTEARSKLGIKRLAARIHELREEGFPIYTNSVVVKGGKNAGKKVTAYRLNVSKTPGSLFFGA
jgi:Helix-turn-helix domain